MKRQQGAALIIIFMMLVIGMVSWQLFATSAEQALLQRQQKSHAALAQAKQALLGYASSYDLTHTGQVFGLFPCPTADNSLGEGSSMGSCGVKNSSQLGRYPWRSLETTVLKDGYAECLWYLISGTFKNNPNSDLLNWDSTGLIQLGSEPDTTDPIIALIIAPGPKTFSQQRNNAVGAHFCQGNYLPNNYLEAFQFNHDANQISLFQQGGHNDTIISIRRSELFSAIMQRNDFPAWVTKMLADSSECLRDLPSPVLLNFDSNPIAESLGTMFYSEQLDTAHPPRNCLSGGQKSWQDQLFYSRCRDGSACLLINSQSCKGLVIFAGQRNENQRRDHNLQRNVIENYLEAETLALLQAKAGSTSSAIFDLNAPQRDLIRCIP